MNTQLIVLDKLTNETYQTRVRLNPKTVADYAEALKDGADFPPVTVFRLGNELRVVDGFHRIAAAAEAGRTEIAAEVIEGSATDALRVALKANDHHGLPRSNADRMKAVRLAWKHRAELFDHEPTKRELATLCGVCLRTVQRVRNEGEGETQSPPEAVAGRHALPVGSAPCADRFGVEIPEKLRPDFAATELAELVETLHTVRDKMHKAIDAARPGFQAVSQVIQVAVDNAHTDLKSALPYCVCRNCQGLGCYTCSNRGWQTKEQYARLPAELK